MSGQRDGFLADAFHEAAVAGQHPGVVVDQVRTELGGELGFGNRHADRIGKALAQRTGGGLDAVGKVVFRVAGSLGMQLAEILDLIDGHVAVAEQVKRGIEQHRAVAGRKDEAIAIGPPGAGGIELHDLGKEHCRNVGAAHGRPGWPELAFSTASIDRDRMALAIWLAVAELVIKVRSLLGSDARKTLLSGRL